MVYLANKVQPVRVGVLFPRGVYSRIVALELHAPGGVGNSDFCFTPPLGNSLWLLGIDVWVYCGTAGQFIGGFFYLSYGASVPNTEAEIATTWDQIIPLHCGLKKGFRWFECEAFHRHFNMNRHFASDGLRFAVGVENGFPQAWEATVAFEISEG